VAWHGFFIVLGTNTTVSLQQQLIYLFVLAIPVACIAWTFTHEEVFREIHEYCVEKSKSCKTVLQRKFFYLFTCEYCFSHYVTALMLIITQYTLLYTNWRGYVIAGFSIVWIANVYMSLYVLIRMDIKKERAEAVIKEEEAEKTINN
jgi:hypothetical protein